MGQSDFMNEAQTASWIAAVVAGTITAILAIRSFGKSIKERKLDLLWKQANAAKEFVHEIHEHPSAAAAISMLDWFIISKYETHEEIEYSEVLNAIPKIVDRSFDAKERYILDCFDWFFYYIDRTEQHINDGLFLFENVKFIFYPYYRKISEHYPLYAKFMEERYYLLAPNFWARYKTDSSFNQNL